MEPTIDPWNEPADWDDEPPLNGPDPDDERDRLLDAEFLDPNYPSKPNQGGR